MWGKVLKNTTQMEKIKLFIGTFKYSMDAKGRIALPAKLRKNVSPDANDTFVMTRGLEKCIDIYPMDNWKLYVADKLNKLNMFDPQDQMFMRLFLNDSSEDSYDSQSRLIIPKSLIEFAGIEKEVLIIGQFVKIEVWNPEHYNALVEKNSDKLTSIAKEVMSS